VELSELLNLAGGHAPARAIQVALKMGLFEALAEGALDASALATRIGAVAPTTALLANALTAIGLLEKASGGYTLTPDARRFLLRSSGNYVGGMIAFDGEVFPLWSGLEDTIRDGRPAREPDMFQHDPQETRLFIGAMDSLVRARGDAVYLAQHLDLSQIATIADVGGGPGTYMMEFLGRFPHLRATILDLPATLRAAREILESRDRGLRARLELMQYDYRSQEFPATFDAIFLSNIIHGENEATNRALVQRCYRGLTRGGTLIVKDHIMDASLVEPAAGAIFSLYLMLVTQGRDYSFDEVAGWLKEAGFSRIRQQHLPAPPFTSSLVVAHK